MIQSPVVSPLMTSISTIIPLSANTGLSHHPQTGSPRNDPHSNFINGFHRPSCQAKHQGNLQ